MPYWLKKDVLRNAARQSAFETEGKRLDTIKEALLEEAAILEYAGGSQGYTKRGGSQRDPNVMDVDRVKIQNRRNLTEDELKEFARLKKCFNCAQVGHIAKNCPRKAQGGWGSSRSSRQGPGKNKPSKKTGFAKHQKARKVDEEDEPIEEDDDSAIINRLKAMLTAIPEEKRIQIMDSAAEDF